MSKTETCHPQVLIAAFHEAAHAVVSIQLGLKFKYVEVTVEVAAEGNIINAGCWRDEPQENGSPEQVKNKLVVMFAGKTAEAHLSRHKVGQSMEKYLTEEAISRGAAKDVLEAEGLAKYIVKYHGSSSKEDHAALLRNAEQRANEILNDQAVFDCVYDLAWRLVRDTTLQFDQVKRFCSYRVNRGLKLPR